MKLLYLDCFAGISGDMFLASLVDMGLDAEQITRQLKQLDLTGYAVRFQPARSHGLAGTRLHIEVQGRQPRRHLRDIEKIISSSKLPGEVKDTSLSIFHNLARAEARVHGTAPEKVHFHEVGAVDSILDIVGASWAVHMLQPVKIHCATLPLGGGYVVCAHGTLPVPAPATAELLRGLPVRWGPVNSELVTPTGAAIVKTLVNSFLAPEMYPQKVGYGIGSRDTGMPNALRVIYGEEVQNTKAAGEEIDVLECNIDDMNPEWAPYLQQKLLAAGALDVFLQHVVMKKGRPGLQVKVLCRPEMSAKLNNIIFNESSTLGIRRRREQRYVLARETSKVDTPYGTVSVKTYIDPAGNRRRAPEFEDCKKVAEKKNIPLWEVYRAASLACTRTEE